MDKKTNSTDTIKVMYGLSMVLYNRWLTGMLTKLKEANVKFVVGL